MWAVLGPRFHFRAGKFAARCFGLRCVFSQDFRCCFFDFRSLFLFAAPGFLLRNPVRAARVLFSVLVLASVLVFPRLRAGVRCQRFSLVRCFLRVDYSALVQRRFWSVLRRPAQARLVQRVLFLCWRAGRFSVFAFKLPLSTGFVVRLGSLLGVLPASVAVRASQQIGFALHS
jgi:hypothetical protein